MFLLKISLNFCFFKGIYRWN